MGLETRAEGKYISIYKGRFAQRVQPNTEGAVGRALEKGPKIGQMVYEKYYDSFVGRLVGLKVTDGPYGKQWDFSFQDQAEIYHLNLPYSNSFAKNILKMLPNVDLSQEFKVTPQTKEVDGVNKSSIFINQNGQSIKHAFTREVPNGLPEMVQVQVKGQLVWDDTAQLEFLENMVKSQVIPKLPKQAVAETSTEAEKPRSSLDNFTDNGAEEDDSGF